MTEELEKARLKELMGFEKAVIVKMYARTLNHLRNIISTLNLWKCPECGNWSMPDCVCHYCIYDPSTIKEERRMSADNWTVCPRCKKKTETAKREQLKNAKAGYGKLSPEEYEEALFKAREIVVIGETLREDYDFYMEDDGTFGASYSAHCDKCGFKHKFKHSEQVFI